MKKRILLFSALLTAGAVSAQFTIDNAPTIGDASELFIRDSTAANLKDVVGDDVTWDYSDLIDYDGETRTIKVIDPVDTDYSTTFSSSQKAIQLADELVTFITDNETERMSQGLVFTDPDLGDLVLNFAVQDGEEGHYLNYPFNLGDSISGQVSGEASFEYEGNPVNTTATGNFHVKVDGRGTLKTGVATEYTNVLRYRIIDTIEIKLDDILGSLPNYVAIHEQYEYYDFEVSNLPIFVHSSLWFGQKNSDNPRNDYTLVLSRDTKTSAISTEELLSTNIYPNPASGFVNIELTNEVANADVVIVDATGRVVIESSVENGASTIDVSSLDMGTYFVKIAAEGKFTTKTLVIK